MSTPVPYVEYASRLRCRRRVAAAVAVAFVVSGCARQPAVSSDTAGSGEPSSSSAVGVPVAERVYIADQTTVAVLDTRDQRLVRSIALRSPTGQLPILAPTGIAIDSTGTRAFVSTLGAGLQEIDLAAGKVIEVDPESDGYAIAAGSRAVAAFLLQVGGADGGTPEVVPVDASDHLGTPLTVGTETDNVQAIAVAPDGNDAYVLLFQGGLVPIDTRTLLVGQPIDLPGDANGVAISPDSQTAYVTEGSTPGVVTVDLATGVVSAPIQIGTDPYGIAITPNGKELYVSDGESVIPIDLATAVAGASINLRPAAAAEPDAIGGPIVITGDGSTAYAADPAAGTVTPIQIATKHPGRPIKVGVRPVALAITS